MIKKFMNIYPGVLACTVVAAASLLIQRSDMFSRIVPLSPLIIAITIGFAINNLFDVPTRFRAGVKFCAKRILRLAIIFMGFKLSLSEIAGVGGSALITISIASAGTLFFTVWLGLRMGIPFKRSILLGSGVSICGASAVAAVDGVIQSREEDAAFAIGAITLIGTFYMFVYPLVYRMTGMTDSVYALWTGASVHEVAQVAAAGSAMNNVTSEALASSVKMIRVLFIIPLTFILLFLPLHKFNSASGDIKPAKKGKVAVPWFAVLFFGAVVVNSFKIISTGATGGIVVADNFLMAAAMAGLGLDISVRSIIKIGKNAFILGIVSSLMISVLSGVVILLLHLF
jgi:uncharacterized integral membrane protein (TIGR00698 family)